MAILGELTNVKIRVPADACVLQKCGTPSDYIVGVYIHNYGLNIR